MLQCNSTLAELRVDEDPLWPAHSGITFHELGLGLSIIFGLISLIVAFYLIYRHATHYLVPSQQKHIIRILLMIPIYSTVSFLSVLYYQHAVYFQVLRDCYEAFAISSFFALMCEYVAPGLHEQKKFFRTLTPVNWFWGVFFMQKCTGGENRGPFRKPRSGLTWFNVVWAGVFQYCLVRVMFTIVSVIAEVFGRYCEHSLNPAFAHIWVVCFEGASVTVAMFCLVQFYIQLKEKLSEYRPALKIICIKLVIFFSFWQTMVISFLASSSGPLKSTNKISYPDIYIGIPSWLLCIEMAFFAILHVFAFPWTPYSLIHGAAAYTSSGNSLENGAPATLPINSRRYRGFWYAIADSFNPWDVVKASARGLRWMFVRYKHRHTDSSYEPAASYKLGSPAGEHGPGATTDGMAMPPVSDLRQTHSNTSLSAAPPAAGRYNAMTTEDDTAGLLNNSVRPGHSHSPQSHSPRHSPPPRSPFNDEYAAGDDGAAVGLDLETAGPMPHSSAARHSPPPRNVWNNSTAYPAHPPALQPGPGPGPQREQRTYSPERHYSPERRETMEEAAASTRPPKYQTTHGNTGWI